MSIFDSIGHAIDNVVNDAVNTAEGIAKTTESIVSEVGKESIGVVTDSVEVIADRAIDLAKGQVLSVIDYGLKEVGVPENVTFSALRLLSGEISAKTFVDNMYSTLISSSGIQLLADADASVKDKKSAKDAITITPKADKKKLQEQFKKHPALKKHAEKQLAAMQAILNDKNQKLSLTISDEVLKTISLEQLLAPDNQTAAAA